MFKELITIISIIKIISLYLSIIYKFNFQITNNCWWISAIIGAIMIFYIHNITTIYQSNVIITIIIECVFWLSMLILNFNYINIILCLIASMSNLILLKYFIITDYSAFPVTSIYPNYNKKSYENKLQYYDLDYLIIYTKNNSYLCTPDLHKETQIDSSLLRDYAIYNIYFDKNTFTNIKLHNGMKYRYERAQYSKKYGKQTIYYDLPFYYVYLCDGKICYFITIPIEKWQYAINELTNKKILYLNNLPLNV